MRTNIEIDDDLLAQAQAIAGTSSKRATVEYALRDLIRRDRRVGVADLKGTGWIGDLQAMRGGDPPTEQFPDGTDFPDIDS